MKDNFRMADDWLHDAARRAKAARVDPTMPNPARVGDALSGGRNAISEHAVPVYGAVARKP